MAVLGGILLLFFVFAALSSGLYWPLFIIATIFSAIFCIACIYNLLSDMRLGNTTKILWLLAMCLLNVVGAIFYLLLKPRYLKAEQGAAANP